MNFRTQVIIRVLPVVLISYLGYEGYQYWQRPLEKKLSSTASDIRSSNEGSKKKGPRSAQGTKKNSGLKTTFLPFKKTDYQVLLYTQGTVIAPEVTTVTSQVNGRVTTLNPNFANGAFVKKGELLAKIDPVDYESSIISAQAALARAHASLTQEVARGEQAIRNWKDIGYDEEPNDLVLRKPQLREAEANVLSAEASLLKAERDLARCEITAPFSGVVRSRDVGIGTVIGGNSKLGELLGTSYAEVRLPLNQEQLKQLRLRKNQSPSVTFTDALDPSSNYSWNGQIVRREGEMDLDSNELFLIARIEDPFSLHNTHQLPLTFNQRLIASLPASVIPDVYIIDREYVLGVSDIITIQDDKVQRIKVEPKWESAQHIVIDAQSIPNGALLATSRLEYATNGSSVTLIDAQGEPIEQTASTTPHRRKREPKS